MSATEYYYGDESRQFSFLMVPKILIDDDYYQELSMESIMLYGLLLDRMNLSQTNGYVDDQNRVFIYFSNDEAMKKLRKSKNVVSTTFKMLEKYGLIERVKHGNDKKSKIYVKKFTQNSISQNMGYGESHFPESGTAISQILGVNKTDNNNNIYIYNQSINQDKYIYSAADETEMNDFDEKLHEKIEYDLLSDRYKHDIGILDNIVSVIKNVHFGKKCDGIYDISGIQYTERFVRDTFNRIDSSHVMYAIETVLAYKKKIRNTQYFLLVILFNAINTMHTSIQSEINEKLPRYTTVMRLQNEEFGEL